MQDNLEIEKEIGVEEIFLFLKKWFKFFFAYKFFILFFFFSGIFYGFFKYKNSVTTYTANLTFIVEEGKNSTNGLGGLASIAGQFGVDFSSGNSGGILSGDNILLYFKSPTLAKEVLLSKYDHSSNNSIADHYIQVYGLTKKWSNIKNIDKINFPPLEIKSNYSRLQDSLILSIAENIIETKFKVQRPDKKASFIEVSVTMIDETLAKIYCEKIVNRVVERYINTKIQRQKATVDKLQYRLDSVSRLLNIKTISSASLQNSSNTADINPLYKTGTSVAVESTLRDKSLLSAIYSTVSQNLEVAKFNLSQETPIIQVIDNPNLPLKQNNESVIKLILMYASISTFLSFLFLITYKQYLNFKNFI